MRGLKNTLIFLAGGVTFAWLYARGCTKETKYPREGSVVYEDDKIKITRMSAEKGKEFDYATIVYKNQTVNEKTEEA